jgi:thiamine kinase-like enzyme
VKRLLRRRARNNHMVARRWLPAVGLERTCPRVLASVSDPARRWTWQIYEDLLGSELNPGGVDRSQVAAVVDVVAELHTRFADHPLLGECRRFGGELGMRFFDAHVIRSQRYLRMIDVPSSEEHAKIRDKLLTRVEQLYAERHQRSRQLELCEVPETLLHGDLWTTNTLIVHNGGCHARLIDWDHVGAGPATYDLSTFLYRFARDDRPWILARYRDAVSACGWELPADRELNLAFATAEYSRYASCLAEAALAASQGERWGFEQLTEIERWFSDLEPVLATDRKRPSPTDPK